MLKKPLEMEIQVQKLSQARRLVRALDKMLSSTSVSTIVAPRAKAGSSDLASRAVSQWRHSVQQTKLFVKETAYDLGLGDYMTERRLPWGLT